MIEDFERFTCFGLFARSYRRVIRSIRRRQDHISSSSRDAAAPAGSIILYFSISQPRMAASSRTAVSKNSTGVFGLSDTNLAVPAITRIHASFRGVSRVFLSVVNRLSGMGMPKNRNRDRDSSWSAIQHLHPRNLPNTIMERPRIVNQWRTPDPPRPSCLRACHPIHPPILTRALNRSQVPPSSILALDVLVQLGQVRARHSGTVPFNPLADARADGQVAQEDELGQRAGMVEI